LTIARDIVRAHGGEIFLEDSPLGGLRARIRLPI
jgi:two-component system osmolarity sensor histidine kinase EnvZ